MYSKFQCPISFMYKHHEFVYLLKGMFQISFLIYVTKSAYLYMINISFVFRLVPQREYKNLKCL